MPRVTHLRLVWYWPAVCTRTPCLGDTRWGRPSLQAFKLPDHLPNSEPSLIVSCFGLADG